MKRPALLALAVLALAACDDTTSDVEQRTVPAALLSGYADQIVVPTYANLADAIVALHESIDALAAEPTEANLAAAREAWRLARIPWEQSEGFLFGPVDTFGYDPALDSWPVNATDLEAVLASDDALSPAYVANLPDELRGFHVVEYFLFGDGGTRLVTDLDERDLAYLTSTAAHLETIATALESAWTAPGEDGKSFRDRFATAGEPGNAAYPSREAALQEMVGGMAAILDEVANGKIADPFDAGDPQLVESQFSYNSIADFSNNIVSVQNTWLGRCEVCGTTATTSLRAFVAEAEPSLATQIDTELAAALTAVQNIPEPFRNAITDPTAADKIVGAQTAIRTALDTIQQDLLPTINP